MRRLPKLNPVVSGILIAASLAGCGGGGGGGSGTSTFFGQSADTVVLLQWKRDGRDVTGTLRQRFLSAADATHAVVPDSTFHGTVNGSTVFLELAAGGTRTGTLHDGRIDLTYPTPQGGLAQIDLGPGARSDYDHALVQLRSDADATRSGDAESRLRERIDADAQHLSDDVDAVTRASADPHDASHTAAARTKAARRHLATTLRDEQRVLAEAGKAARDKVCSDANVVAADAAQVSQDLTAAAPGQSAPAPSAVPPDTIAPTTDDPRALLTALLHDQTQLATDRARLPRYQPVLAPAPAKVFAALRSARKRVARLTSGETGGEKESKAILSTARGYQQAALKACYSA